MSHRADLPNFVYLHFDGDGRVIYVGRTSRPQVRPRESGERPWIASESARVELSPAMSLEAAAWVESELIRGINPKHNHINADRPSDDWRIRRICETEDMSVADARYMARYMPTEREAFEAFLAMRQSNRTESAARSR